MHSRICQTSPATPAEPGASYEALGSGFGGTEQCHLGARRPRVSWSYL